MQPNPLIAERYQITQQLDSRVSHEVWQAYDQLLDRQVILRRARLNEATQRRGARRASLLRTQAHRVGELAVVDVAEEDDELWVVMELPTGRSLTEILHEQGSLPEVQVARLGIQIADSLQALHRAGDIHGGFAPEDVFLTDDGRATIVDFELPELVDGAGNSLEDGTTSPLDYRAPSPGYRAPEIIDGDRPTSATDMYALGATLYTAVEGHSPYDEAGTLPEVLSRVVGTVVEFRQAKALVTVLTELLRKNPAERPDAAQARRMLSRLVSPDAMPVGDDWTALPRSADRLRRVLRSIMPRAPRRRTDVTIPVTIYLSDEAAHKEVRAAVEKLLRSEGADVIARDDPVLGSWFQGMRARIRRGADSPLTREVARSAVHALDGRLVHAQDAANTATMLQPLAPVLASLQPVKEAVIRVGALLIVKVDDSVAVHQLTATQQLWLDHHPGLLRSPKDILSDLDLTGNTSLPSPVSASVLTAERVPDGEALDTSRPPELDHRDQKADS